VNNLLRVIQNAPDCAEAYGNLGFLLAKRGKSEAAEVCYRRSIALNPALPESHLNLGVLLASQKLFNAARVAYLQAIALEPHSPIVWSNLGVLNACLKLEGEAEQCYRTALSLDDCYAAARFNLSYLLLRQGRFEEGWFCLESRNYLTPLSADMTCPRWQGEALSGKSILISHEAGQGDVIQFSRYAMVLKAKGAASVTLICHPALKILFEEGLEGVDRIVSLDEVVDTASQDFWTPLFSIPHYCKTRLDSIPASIPYLRLQPERIKKWAQLIPDKGLRVGLVWKGNPKFENDADRSLASLEVLAPLWKVDETHFISLQKGAGEEEAMHPPGGLPLINLGSQLTDFVDTAAIIAGLDLVICVDTAVAHLTGALGKPCWVLLPDFKTDWRWLTDRIDSPWYPGVMRLFRQSPAGNWTTVVTEVAAALENLASGH
jgi:hypothetical protein